MNLFWLSFAAALVISAIGFKRYIWFISIGYGFSILAIGVLLLAAGRGQVTGSLAASCILFCLYGARLGGYLAYRDFRSGSYNAKMKTETKDGSDMPVIAKISIWVSAAFLYACETAPVSFRIMNEKGVSTAVTVGAVIMAAGLVIETLADLQKNAAKKRNPNRFVDTGLYRMVRCPNYFGEMLFWTGTFITGIGSNTGALQWIAVIIGYAGIIYVMFSGARRLEMRQNRTYGNDPEYQAYVKKTPIMIPLVPIYSVEKHKWLVA